MNILLIEDDAVLSDGLAHVLQQSGFTVCSTESGKYALQLIHAQGFDLIVLDLGLPDMDGLEVLRSLRKQKIALPIIILTARDGVTDRIEGISQGADDYLTKPFDLGELEARIHALIRRCYGGFSHRIEVGRLVLDTQTHQVFADGQALNLPIRKIAILEVLMLHVGKVVSKDKIAQRLASANEAPADNAIEVSIHRLRKRLEPYHIVIRTIRGLGYLLEKQDHGK